MPVTQPAALPVSRCTRLRAPVLGVSGGATLLGLLVALGGVWVADPEVPPWPRFWATAFFTVLLWPVGLTLLGFASSMRLQVAAAAVMVVASVAQQVPRRAMLLPEQVRWSATLSAPGDAIRQRIELPAPEDTVWTRVWQKATHAALVICSERAVAPEARVTVLPSGITGVASPVALASLERTGKPEEMGWYALPVMHQLLLGTRRLDVVVERTGAEGVPALLCGGRDDPARPGAGGSERRRNGQWSAAHLADQPLPPVLGRPPAGRYYVELRLYDAQGRPPIDIRY